MSNRVIIFDTTSAMASSPPGATMNLQEKLRMARQLESLGVDVIEAGFPISSPGDFNSVLEISKAVSAPTICALTRAVKKHRRRRRWPCDWPGHKRIHTV